MPMDFSKRSFRAGFAELNPLNEPGPFVKPTADGRFDFAIPESTIRLRDFSLDDGWFVAGIRQDGQDVSASGFSVSPGQESTLEIVISKNGGIISGIIRDREQNPI